MIALVLVSHSARLAEGVRELAAQMTGGKPVPVFAVGGTDEGEIGTSLEKIIQALDAALQAGEAVVILADLGSAVMTAQMAVEFLPPEEQARVRLVDAPLVEGAISAAATAAGGGDVEAVCEAARQARTLPKLYAGEPQPAAPPSSEAESASVEVTIVNPTGLHARPAAQFVQAATGFQAEITVENLSKGRPAANAKSVMAVLGQATAEKGERVRITARGPDAKEAVEALKRLIESGFGELEAAPPSPGTTPSSAPPPAPTVEAPLPGAVLRGIAASEGIAIAPACPFTAARPRVSRRTVEDVEAEIARLRAAIGEAKGALETLQTEVAREDAEAARIFEFQRTVLDDPAILQALEETIREERCNAETAVEKVFGEWKARFRAMESELFRLRAADVEDVATRLLRELVGAEGSPPALPDEPVILIAADLTPSDIAQLERAQVKAICTAAGGATSHVAILSRTRGIPAVVGLGEAILNVEAGTLLAVDGGEGVVVVAPSPDVLAEYRARAERQAKLQAAAMRAREAVAETPDGHRVMVAANIGGVESAREAVETGAEGAGLLRTEFLYLNRETLPDEEEQVAIYRAIAEVMGRRPVIVRTMDVGGDKPLPAIEQPPDKNPALGVRAIRLSRLYPHLFLTQIRAILRAAVGHDLQIMFPLITTVEEVRWAKAQVEEAKRQLREEGLPFATDVPLGIMVETPAAAMKADHLAHEVDFFSIGSNDLTQYTMASDRENEHLRNLLTPFDPAVLRLIARTIRAGHEAGIPVGLCGEMAGHRLAVPLLLGMGLDEFSMAAQAIPLTRQLIRAMRWEEAKAIAATTLEMATAEEVMRYLRTVAEELESRLATA